MNYNSFIKKEVFFDTPESFYKSVPALSPKERNSDPPETSEVLMFFSRLPMDVKINKTMRRIFSRPGYIDEFTYMLRGEKFKIISCEKCKNDRYTLSVDNTGLNDDEKREKYVGLTLTSDNMERFYVGEEFFDFIKIFGEHCCLDIE